MKDSLELKVRTIPLFITTSQNYSYFLPSQSLIRWVDENVAPPTETFSSVTLNITYTTAGNVRIDVNWGNGGFSLNFQVLYSYFSSLQSRFKGNENVLPPSEPFELHLCSTCVSLDETKKKNSYRVNLSSVSSRARLTVTHDRKSGSGVWSSHTDIPEHKTCHEIDTWAVCLERNWRSLKKACGLSRQPFFPPFQAFFFLMLVLRGREGGRVEGRGEYMVE